MNTQVAHPGATPGALTNAAPTPGPSIFGADRGGAWLYGPVGSVLFTFRRELLWVLVFSAFANVLLLAPTIYMLQLFDRVLHSGNELTLLAMTLLLVLFCAALALAEWLRSRLLVRSSNRLDDALGSRVFAVAYAAQLAQPQRAPQRPLADFAQLRQFLTGNGIFAMADAPWAILFIGVLFLMHPLLGWLSILFCVVQVVVAVLAQRMFSGRQRAVQDLDQEVAQYLQVKLRNAESVAAMGMQPALQRHWRELQQQQLAHQDASHESATRIQSLMKWLQYTQQALMLSLGAWLAIRGEITVGAMVASNALSGNALRPVTMLVSAWGPAIEVRAAWARLDALLIKHERAASQQDDATLSGAVSLIDLTASVEGRREPILQGITAEFAAGEVVGIVGPSGAGKSTLARCLLGIWPQRSGKVLFDGQPVEQLSRDAIGPQLGYLPQDIDLFDGTIAENIARFSAAEPEAVVDAARMAGIHEMVLRLPNGYDTPIGESGNILSGGQRQRLGLARACLGTPRIVVLDEPNANLDDAGEAALVKAVLAMKTRQTTVFMIVHRPALLAVADRILVLENGRMTRLATVQRAVQPAPAPAERKS